VAAVECGIAAHRLKSLRTYDRLTSQFVAAYVAGLDGWREELGRMVGALGKRNR